VGKRVNKTLHSVLARWISTEDRELGHNNDNKEEEGDEENENEGYNSDIGYDLLSKRWSREETKMQDKHDDNNYEGTDNDEIESEQDISVEMNERSGHRNRVSKGEQKLGEVWEVRQKEQGVTRQGITINGLGNDAELCFK
jgi:hypothetical protein